MFLERLYLVRRAGCSMDILKQIFQFTWTLFDWKWIALTLMMHPVLLLRFSTDQQLLQILGGCFTTRWSSAFVRLDWWWWSFFSFHTNPPPPPLLQHTPLNAPGIYIRTLIPDGPAASDGRLKIGDRILAVNGTSLIGADYQRYGWQDKLTVLLGEIDCNGGRHQ